MFTETPTMALEDARAATRARTDLTLQARTRCLLGPPGGVLEQEEEMLLAPRLTRTNLLRLSETAPSLKSYRGLLKTIRLLRWDEGARVAVLSDQRRLQELVFQHPVPMGGVLGALPRDTLSTLRRLDFRGHVCAGASTWSALVEALEGGALRGLEELRIEPAFTLEGARGVASALAKGACPSLRVLDLSGRGSPPLSERWGEVLKAQRALAMGVAEALALGACPQLEVLRLDEKIITEENVGALGDALRACPQLRTLRLDTGCAAAGAPRLLAALRDGACPGIQTLAFRQSLLMHAEAAEALARAMEAGFLGKLENLHLGATDDFREDAPGDAGAVPLVRAWQMGMCPRLRTLDFDGNGLTHVTCEALAQAMLHEGLPLLEVLDIRWNVGVGNEGVRALAEAWERGDCPGLRELNLSHTGITAKGCAILADCGGRGGLPRLETLDLSENKIGDQGVIGLTAAWRAGGAPDLRGLNMSEIEMTDEGFEALVKALQDGLLPSLEVLELAKNYGTVRGREALGRALQACPRPRLMKLNINEIDLEGADGGAKEFVVALSAGACKNLRSLQFDGVEEQYPREGDPGITGDIVAQGLVQAMAEGALEQLEVLSIAYNEIKDDNFEAICCELEQGRCPRLRILSARYNRIGDKGVEALARAMRAGQLPRLEGLYLGGNRGITNVGALALAAALEAGGGLALKQLNLEASVGIEVPGPGQEALLRASSACPLVEEEGIQVRRGWKRVLDTADRVDWGL
jgi:Ran GTPase-activating protein (RanGAP) involved in mRNA processing and transport